MSYDHQAAPAQDATTRERTSNMNSYRFPKNHPDFLATHSGILPVLGYENEPDQGKSIASILPKPIENTDLYQQISQMVFSRHFEKAAAQFAEKIHLLIETLPQPKLQMLLTELSTQLGTPNADLLYGEAMLTLHAGYAESAILQLQHAQTHYWAAKRRPEAIRCTVDIARSYLNQENFDMAMRYLEEETKPLLDHCTQMSADVRADYLLQMANLATDTGNLIASTEYALQALDYYIKDNNLPGQFRAQLRIARNYMQCGNYPEAQSRLQLIRQYFHIGKLGAASEGLLLNAEIHLRWYQHHLDGALRLTQLYLRLADHEQLPYAQIYARILLANLYRDKEDFKSATEWYNETERWINKLEHYFYQPWLDAQRAWLLVRQDELAQAEVYYSRALRSKDRGQRMSFQVGKSVIFLRRGQYEEAKELLNQSLAFYEASGDLLACSTIHIYLAYAAIRQNDSYALWRHLDGGFTHMAAMKLDTLPYWWHPEIIAEVCCQAIVANIYPMTIRDIVTRRLMDHSTSALMKLIRCDDLDIREQARQLLNRINGQSTSVLEHLGEGPAKRILEESMGKGHLCPEGFEGLEHELTTAQLRRSPNITLIAVFALHTTGLKRAKIAERLGCTKENVRNYITKIYKLFEVSEEVFRTRESRRLQLVAIARERGYIH